jgi:hypothetical protein
MASWRGGVLVDWNRLKRFQSTSASVAMALSMANLPKSKWLKSFAIDLDWPVHGMPEVLHLDEVFGTECWPTDYANMVMHRVTPPSSSAH